VIKKEEEKEQEIKEEKADSCPSDGDVSSDDSEVITPTSGFSKSHGSI
jgi:hypothetical protein